MGHDILAYRLKPGITEDHELGEERFTKSDIIDLTANGDKPYTVPGEIAYNRRGAGNPINDALYIVLEAERHYCGVSGCGTGGFFTSEQLLTALFRITSQTYMEEYYELSYEEESFEEMFEQEAEFIRNCLLNLNDQDLVYINFG